MTTRQVQHTKSAARREAPPRTGRFTQVAVAAGLSIAVSGCASLDAGQPAPWKMEPLYKVNHTMQSSQAYYELGRYYDGSQLWDKAIDAYRKAIAVDAGNVEAFNALGVALAQSGRYADAEITLRQAVALAPDRSHILNNLGYVLLLAGKNDDAVAVLKTALARDGGNAGAAANLQLAMARATPPSHAALGAEGAAPASEASAKQAAAQQVSDRPDTYLAAVERETSPPASKGKPVAEASAAPRPPVTSTSTPGSSAPSARAAAFHETASRLEISNGNGLPGMAARVSRWLAARGIATQRLTNQPSFDLQHTVVQYREGDEQAAMRLVRSMPANVKLDAKPTPGLRSNVRVVLGHDWLKIAACLDSNTCGAAGTPVAMANP
jgi:tetratricopeptide (TPR) repeat protein